MTLEYFRGDGKRPDGPVEIRPARLTPQGFRDLSDPSKYITPQPLVRAVNVALALRAPLLVSGEPGCGKTQLGAAVAYELGRPGPFLFVTRSATVARDVFYEYDAIGHFHAAQASREATIDVRTFISYRALGVAILLALTPDQRAPFLRQAGIAGGLAVGEQTDEVMRLLATGQQYQSIVVIDEIDKASRDVPNDLLDQIEHMRFEVAEMQGIRTPPLDSKFRPIVFITTNTERQLPEAFLRRCIYAHAEFPKGDLLVRIAESRVGSMLEGQDALVRDAMKFFETVRENEQLSKKPGTAEFLGWLQAMLEDGADPAKGLGPQESSARLATGVLSKLKDDSDLLTLLLDRYLGANRS